MTCKGLIIPREMTELEALGGGRGTELLLPSQTPESHLHLRREENGRISQGGPHWHRRVPSRSLFTECPLPSPLTFTPGHRSGSAQRAPPAGSHPEPSEPPRVHAQQRVSSPGSLCAGHPCIPVPLAQGGAQRGSVAVRAGERPCGRGVGSTLGHMPTPLKVWCAAATHLAGWWGQKLWVPAGVWGSPPGMEKI